MNKNYYLLVTAIAVACGGSEKDSKSPKVDKPEPIVKTLGDIGLDAAALDKSVAPCDDFFQFACGGWLENNPIPEDKSSFGRFHEINDRNEAALKEILDRLQTSERESLSPAEGKVADFYGACMDEEAIEKSGIAPVRPLLDQISAIKTREQLAAALTTLHQHRMWALWSLEAEADFKDATMSILFMDQAGLGLPDRDYYVKTDKNMASIRDAYKAHIKRMFVLAGNKRGADRAVRNIMDIEMRLAKASKSATERRDPQSLYNKVDREGVAKLVTKIDWTNYFATLGSPELDGISVTAPTFFKQANTELATTPIPALRDYLTWHVLRKSAPQLSKAFADESFTLTSTLTGQKQQRDRWKRCLSATNAHVGELLAQPFIEKMFPGDSKEAAESMVNAISSAFKDELSKLDWMSPETKEKAEEKRAAMAYLIGYPSSWKKYDFEIGESYASNVLGAEAWELKRQLAKVGKAYDRSEWFMVPQTVNAYYNPLANQMVFPAGILQKPFFDAGASEPVNLGAMGMIVGHELTHGFDDSGSQFAADGNMSNWWQQEDLERFKAKGECVVQQYASYEPLPGEHINGQLTLGENIADIGGVKLAYHAYRKLRADKQPVIADGFNEDQQFFLAVGQAWCNKYRDEVLRQRLVTDPHSPSRFRVNGALANQPEFAAAFECSGETAMQPANACEVW